MTRAAPYGSAAWRAWKHDHHWAAGGGAPADPLGAGNTALIGASGLNVTPLAFYDVRKNLAVASGTASSLADVSGVGTYGPALNQATQAAQPTWDGTTLNFDGVNDFLLSASAIAALDLSLNPCAYTDVLIADVGSTTFKASGAIGAAAGAAPNWLQEVRTGPVWQGISDLLTSAGNTTLPATGSIHLFISTFSFTTTPSKKLIMNVQVPPAAMTTNAGSAVGPETAGGCFISVGGTTSGASSAVLRFRARLILPGIVSAGQVSTLATWASTYHAAVVS